MYMFLLLASADDDANCCDGILGSEPSWWNHKTNKWPRIPQRIGLDWRLVANPNHAAMDRNAGCLLRPNVSPLERDPGMDVKKCVYGIFGHHAAAGCGCDVAPSCGCEMAVPSCGCEIAPACGCDAAPRAHRHGLFARLHARKAACVDMCAPVCEPAPVCCAPMPAPTCCEPVADCCGGSAHVGLFAKLRAHCAAKKASCCEVPSCGCGAPAGCGCGM